MAAFSFAAFAGTGFGPLFAGWIAMNPHLEWRWIQWISFMFVLFIFNKVRVDANEQNVYCRAAGVLGVVMIFTMKETRSSVLLTRLAKKLRKDTGDNRYRARIEDERGSLRSLIAVSLTRPISGLTQ